MKISVIIPMYNENAVIKSTAKTLSSYMSENFDSYEIIFSDDGSTDGCRQTVESLGLECVRVIGYKENKGKGSAVRHGMLSADGDIRLFTDADLAYGTDVIKKAYDKLCGADDADILIGTRKSDKNSYVGYTPIRRFMSKTYIRIVRTLSGVKISDSQCGFKAFRAGAADEIFSACTTNGFSFDLEVLLRAACTDKKIIEMPVRIINHSHSSVRPIRDALKMIRDISRIKRQIKRSK